MSCRPTISSVGLKVGRAEADSGAATNGGRTHVARSWHELDQEPDRRRLALLDRLMRANQRLWDRFTLDAQQARIAALRDALDGGCGPDRFMAHVAIQEADADGQVVTWLEHVTDEEYGGR